MSKEISHRHCTTKIEGISHNHFTTKIDLIRREITAFPMATIALFVRLYEILGSSETATGDGDGRAPQLFS